MSKDGYRTGDANRIRVPAAAIEIPRIRAAVLASAAAHAVARTSAHDIALAVSEACANVVMHAYPNAAGPGPLIVEAYRENDQFVVVVRDDGTGITPRADSPGLGLGLGLIGRLTDRLEIANQDPMGATVTMVFAAR